MAAVALVFLSLLFIVTHIGMSAEPFRSNMVKRLGELGFKGVYSLISILTLGGAILFFIHYRETLHESAPLWNMHPLWVFLALILIFVSIPLVVFGLTQPSPTGMAQISYEPLGILLVTRHPVNIGIALFGLAHMLANPRLGDAALFGSLFIVGFFGAFHQDARKTRTLGEQFASFKAKTSIIPLAAIVTKKNNFSLNDLSKPMLILCVLLYFGLMIFHKKLFGVSVF